MPMRASLYTRYDMKMTIPEIKDLLDKADEKEFKALERSLAADTRKGVKTAIETARRRLESHRLERERVEALYAFERSLAADCAENPVIVGLDEVGRGSVAGPLAVGAVVLDGGSIIEGLNDSKQIKPERRSEIAAVIKETARAWAVYYISPQDIDRDGMTLSLRRAFAGALADVEGQGVSVDVVLIDGNPLKLDPREINVVKGDAKCASIAAASILAKTERDEYMASISSRYPAYAFDVNKGYASPQHIEAIRTYGLTDLHRASFCKAFMQETLF